jgi:hypothetical protein
MEERRGKAVACLQDQTLREFRLFDKIVCGDVQHVAWTLKGNTWLVSLDISHIGMYTSDSQELADALAENHTLESINLSSNGLGSTGGTQILSMLEKNSSLRHVNLFSNFIDPSASDAVGSMLVKNTTLEDLNLSYNKFGDRICHTLVKVMHANSTLQSLNVSGNGCTAEGYAIMAEMLRTNRTLRTLAMYPGPSTHTHGQNTDTNVHDDDAHTENSEKKQESNTTGTTAASRLARCAYKECQTIEAQFLEVLLSHPRRHVFNLKGLELNTEMLSPGFKMSFPACASTWLNMQICQHIHDMHVGKFVAFAMGSHARLGDESEVRFLGEDLVYAIVQTLYVI